MLRAGFRRGDRAPMAILEFVDRPGELRPARPPRIPATAAAPAAAPRETTLEERLAAAVAAQNAVRASAAAGALPPLTPSFPAPHVPVIAWRDDLWQPRGKAARLAIAAGGTRSPLSRKGGKGGPPAAARAAPAEPELR